MRTADRYGGVLRLRRNLIEAPSAPLRCAMPGCERAMGPEHSRDTIGTTLCVRQREPAVRTTNLLPSKCSRFLVLQVPSWCPRQVRRKSKIGPMLAIGSVSQRLQRWRNEHFRHMSAQSCQSSLRHRSRSHQRTSSGRRPRGHLDVVPPLGTTSIWVCKRARR